MGSELPGRFRPRQHDSRLPQHHHTSITRGANVVCKRLIWRAGRRRSRVFDSHHPLHSPLRARVSLAAFLETQWFEASIIALTGSDHAAFVAWLKAPVPACLVILLSIARAHHAAPGLQVVIEDCLHAGAEFATLVVMRLSCFALAVAGIVARMRIAFRD